MTQLDVLYRFGIPPSESSVMAITRIREIYGVRQVHLDERAKTVRIEYDASRLTEPVIQQFLRRSGLDIQEIVPLVPAEPPKPAIDPLPSA